MVLEGVRDFGREREASASASFSVPKAHPYLDGASRFR